MTQSLSLKLHIIKTESQDWTGPRAELVWFWTWLVLGWIGPEAQDLSCAGPMHTCIAIFKTDCFEWEIVTYN